MSTVARLYAVARVSAARQVDGLKRPFWEGTFRLPSCEKR